MPNDNTNSARAKTTTRILKLFKQRKMAKNYGTHALHGRPTFVKIPGAGCKKIGRINNLGREESNFFCKKNAKWFFSDNSDPEVG